MKKKIKVPIVSNKVKQNSLLNKYLTGFFKKYYLQIEDIIILFLYIGRKFSYQIFSQICSMKNFSFCKEIFLYLCESQLKDLSI